MSKKLSYHIHSMEFFCESANIIFKLIQIIIYISDYKLI